MGLGKYLKTNSTESSMRLALILGTITACSIAFVTIVFNFVLLILERGVLDIAAVALLVTGILAAVAGGKAVQSFSESRQNPVEPPQN